MNNTLYKRWHSVLCMAVCALLCCVNATAQTDFNDGKSFKEILGMSAEQGKPVFIDCYTSWCGPCKAMARDVFPQKEAGEYFNTKFVCWKVDMEKGEGPDLAKKYDVAAYPTFLILNSDGSLRATHVGSAPLNKFIPAIDKLLNDEKGLPWYQKQFKEGNRDKAFLNEYIELMDNKYLRNEKKRVVETLFEGKTAAQIVADEESYRLFLGTDFTPDDQLFLDVYRLRSTVLSNYDEKSATALDDAWRRGARESIEFEGREFKSFNMDKFQAYKKKMKEYNVVGIDHIEDVTLVAVANYRKDYATLAKYLEKDIKTGGAVWTNTRDMLPLLQGMADNCGQDKKMRKVVTRAAKFRIDLLKKMDINSKEPQRQVTVGGVKMTASEFLSNNFQKIIDKLK